MKYFQNVLARVWCVIWGSCLTAKYAKEITLQLHNCMHSNVHLCIYCQNWPHLDKWLETVHSRAEDWILYMIKEKSLSLTLYPQGYIFSASSYRIVRLYFGPLGPYGPRCTFEGTWFRPWGAKMCLDCTFFSSQRTEENFTAGPVTPINTHRRFYCINSRIQWFTLPILSGWNVSAPS